MNENDWDDIEALLMVAANLRTELLREADALGWHIDDRALAAAVSIAAIVSVDRDQP